MTNKARSKAAKKAWRTRKRRLAGNRAAAKKAWRTRKRKRRRKRKKAGLKERIASVIG